MFDEYEKWCFIAELVAKMLNDSGESVENIVDMFCPGGLELAGFHRGEVGFDLCVDFVDDKPRLVLYEDCEEIAELFIGVSNGYEVDYLKAIEWGRLTADLTRDSADLKSE